MRCGTLGEWKMNLGDFTAFFLAGLCFGEDGSF